MEGIFMAKTPKLRMFLVQRDGTKEEVDFTVNWDAIKAGCLRHQKEPKIHRIGQRDHRGLFRRIGDD
jgi:hypothetical protein